MEKKKRSNLTIFAILTTITIVVWVLAESYNRFTKTEIKTIPPKILVPLSASLDKETLDTIEKRRVFSKEEVSSFLPAGQAGLAISPAQESPEATNSATPSGGLP